MRILFIPILLTLLLAGLPAGAASQQKEAAAVLRVPVAEEGEERIHRLLTRVRHTTVIVLPAGENILDFVAGDSEYWHLTGPAFVARSEVAAYREMAAQAADAARTAREQAQAQVIEVRAEAEAAIETFRAEYPGRLAFEYRLDRSAFERPFLVDAMWHDGRFTYVRSNAQESPALYELKDGEPALVAFDLIDDGLYIARHVLGDGWLQIGDERTRWRFEPRDGDR